MPEIEPHCRFSKSTVCSEQQVSSFAALAGDTNPIHHDRDYARQRGFGGLTLSGAQSGSLLMGLVADHFAQIGPMVGLEMKFYFRKPALAGIPIELEWLIVRNTAKRHIGAHLLELRGRLQHPSIGTAVGAKGKVLVYDAHEGTLDPTTQERRVLEQ